MELKDAKPCVHCGSTDLILNGCNADKNFWVECKACKAGGPDKLTRTQAVAAWNHRERKGK